MKVLAVTNMYPQPDRPAFGTFVQDQVEALRRQGIEVDVLFINGRTSKLNYLWGLVRLWWQLLKKRYDIIHAHYVFSGIVSRLQPLVPVIVTYHGSELGVGPDYWLSKLARAVAPFFQMVIVVSPQMRQMLNSSNVRVIPCGVNLDDIKPISLIEARQQTGLPLDKPLVVWAGEHWRPEKRYAILEQAVEIVRQAMPDVQLVLVSGQPHRVVSTYMNACDVLALTSAHEGSPMVIKEAMACNLPIVSVDVGDAAQVINETQHCYIVAPTPEAVADKLRLVLLDRPRTNGRNKIGHLESNYVARQIIEVYKEICKA